MRALPGLLGNCNGRPRSLLLKYVHIRRADGGKVASKVIKAIIASVDQGIGKLGEIDD